MLRNIAVSTIVVILIPLVSIVTGQNSSTATNVQTRQNNSFSISTSHEISGKISKTSTALSSRKTSSSQFVMSTTNPLNKTNSKYSTSTLPQTMSSKFLSTLSSTTGNIDTTFSSYSLCPTKSSEMHVSSTSTINSFVFATSSNLSFPTTSSTFHKVSNSSSSHSLTSSSTRSISVPTTSSIHSSTVALSNTMSHLSTPSVMFSTSQGVHSSSTHLLSSPMGGNSTLTVHSSTFITTSPSRSSSFSSTMLFTSPLTPFSASSHSGNKTIGITTITSNHEPSADHLSSFTQEISPTSSLLETSSQIFSSRLLMSPSRNTSRKSLKITFVRQTPSETPTSTLPIKSSEAKNYSKLTKTSSSTTTKMAPSSTDVVPNNIFLEFDGKLVLSPKSSSKEIRINFMKLADSIESILDEALQQINGYIYSKILIITPQDDQSKFDCMFKVFIRKPSSETATTLQEKINKYNETNGFGEFTLHSVETSVASNQPRTEEMLYLWAIIVIAALGVLCLLFLAAFIYTKRKLKKTRKRNHSSPKHDNNSNKRYNDFFPSVFGGNDESKNVPLQLTSVSSTESKKPLKFSDTAETDSEQDDDNGKKSDKDSIEEGEREDDKLDVQEQSQPSNAVLQIQDTDDEKDQTKFSTFSRKR